MRHTKRHDEEADLEKLLRQRLDRLMAPIGRQSADAVPQVRTVQDAILEIASKLDRPAWEVYIVGGTLREFLTGTDAKGDVQPRDVDIIVSGATAAQLLKALEKPLVLERLTRFGGLHMIRPLRPSGRVLFDVWRLEDTWGFHSQQITPRIEDFPQTTFLNIDSCAIELRKPGKGERRLFEKGFFAAIRDRALDINYAPNPYPHICAARSLLIAARLDFSLSPDLAGFVLDQASDGIQAFIDAQSSHYGTVRAETAELQCWLAMIRKQFDRGQKSIRIDVPESRRRELGLYEVIGAGTQKASGLA